MMINDFQCTYTVDFTRDIQRDGSVLVYTNDGGGGHKQAANAEEREFKLQQKLYQEKLNVENPKDSKSLKGKIKTVDVVGGSFPPLFDTLMKHLLSRAWNKAKKNGDIQAQENLLHGKILGIVKAILADLLLFIPVFISTFFRLVFNKNITRIIDTQPVATSAIIKAARLVNFLFRRKIRVTKVMTDLPTEGAVHFSRSIKRLSKKDKAIIEVVTTKPLRLDENETEQKWWSRVFGLQYNPKDHENSQVKYCEFPLRPAFLKWKNVPQSTRQDHLNVKVNNDEEFQFINELMGGTLVKQEVEFGSDSSKKKNAVSIPMDPKKDAVSMITIGSQAAVKTKEYVKNYIDYAKTLPNDRQYILYAGCGRHIPKQNTLFKEVYELIKEEKLPENIKVIPIGFQDDDEFAAMMHHIGPMNDPMSFAIAGTGGLTTMEMVRTVKGKIYLHSEAEPKKLKKPDGRNDKFAKIITDPTQRQLLDGFAVWEKWNALYQVKEKQAEVVVPGKIFTNALIRLVQCKEPAEIEPLKKATPFNCQSDAKSKSTDNNREYVDVAIA